MTASSAVVFPLDAGNTLLEYPALLGVLEAG